jgi:hypothetical protein
MRVAVPAGAASTPLCDTSLLQASAGSEGAPSASSSPLSNPVCVTIDGTNGITPVEELQVASFTPIAGPVLTSSSVSAVGAGATVSLTLFGDALDQLAFSGPNKVALDFGPGIAVVPGSIKVAADGKSLTVKIQVAPNAQAQLGFHDIAIVGPDSEIVATLSGALVVNRAPTVTGAGTGADGSGPLLSPSGGDVLRGQTLIITGTDFQAATTVPSDLLVSISGAGITVNSVNFDSSTQLSLDVDVAAGAQSAAHRQVQVTNPDLGTGSSAAILTIQVADSASNVPVGLAPRRTSGIVTLPPAPIVNGIAPASAPTGATVVISGSKFSATLANNFVTFTGPGQSQVLGTIVSARAAALTVVVPSTAVDGPVTVAVSGVQGASAPNFTVTNPSVSAVTVGGAPASARRGDSVVVQLSGSKFQPGALVSLDPPADVTVGAATVTPTHISVPISIGLGAALDYVASVGKARIRGHEEGLMRYAHDRLREINSLRIFGTTKDKGPIVSFEMKGAHPHDVATIIDRSGVAVRAGTHCVMPLLARFGVTASCRASFAMYNTQAEIDCLAQALLKAQDFFA